MKKSKFPWWKNTVVVISSVYNNRSSEVYT